MAVMEKKNEIAVLEPKQISIVPESSVMDKLLAVASSGMDISMVEKFMVLAERNEANEARRAYNKAFAAFKADPPEIVKDRTVDYKNTHYTHASIGAVVSAIIEKMSEFGLSHSWFIQQESQNITVVCRITHELGHFEETGITAGADTSGGKNSIQAIASTITYLERYTIQAATGIAVLENDDDGQGHQDPDPNQQQQPKKKGPVSNPENVKLWAEWMTTNVNKGCTDTDLEDAFKTIQSQKDQFSAEDFEELTDLKNDLVKEIQQRV